MQPYQLFRQAYKPMIDLFRANMKDSGALRIDHVMALLRLWWVPKGSQSAGEGAYVYYPIMDLLGILALESQRQQAVVIGEDLGTVPDGIFDLLQQFGMLALGTDFPVEQTNPFLTIHAAVKRKNKQNEPKNGFYMQEALTLDEVLKGMTIWAAKSVFKEKEVGSIEVGKKADFVILPTDLMDASITEIYQTKVEQVYLNGKRVK
jgi:hypothetical protein